MTYDQACTEADSKVIVFLEIQTSCWGCASDRLSVDTTVTDAQSALQRAGFFFFLQGKHHFREEVRGQETDGGKPGISCHAPNR